MNSTSNLNLVSVYDINTNDGSDIKLPYTYILWSHAINDNNWTLSSYKKLCTIRSVSDFWRLFNNFKKIGWKYMHFFFMKSGIEPMWEHPSNRTGGICSFRIPLDDNALAIWENLNVQWVCQQLSTMEDDINGISINPKNNWALIKIWNADSSNNLMNTLCPNIIETYKDLSIQYKANKPEY